MQVLKRQPLFALLGVILAILLLLVGVWLGGHPAKLPAFVRNAFVANHETQVVNDAIERVAHDYYRPSPSPPCRAPRSAG